VFFGKEGVQELSESLHSVGGMEREGGAVYVPTKDSLVGSEGSVTFFHFGVGNDG
jgi:hypothetical protein